MAEDCLRRHRSIPIPHGQRSARGSGLLRRRPPALAPLALSFDTNLLGIENVDYTSLQLPITLLILVSTIKTLENPSNKNLFILSLILSLSISIIMVFLPFVISIFLVLFTKLILISKKINNFILFVLFFICGLIIFNFPIIGRIPKILYNVLFSLYTYAFKTRPQIRDLIFAHGHIYQVRQDLPL